MRSCVARSGDGCHSEAARCQARSLPTATRQCSTKTLSVGRSGFPFPCSPVLRRSHGKSWPERDLGPSPLTPRVLRRPITGSRAAAPSYTGRSSGKFRPWFVAQDFVDSTPNTNDLGADRTTTGRLVWRHTSGRRT
jgi:hypothetical protein